MIHIQSFLVAQFFTAWGQRLCIDWNTKCRFDRREREKRNQRADKKKSRNIIWKIYKKSLLNTRHTQKYFQRGTEVPPRTIRPLVGPLVDWNILLSSPTRKHLMFQKISVCGRYQCQKNFILHSLKSLTPKYRCQLWGKESTLTTVVHFVWRNVTWTVGCAVNCVATVDVTNRHIGQWSDRRRAVLLAMTYSRVTQYKHVTVRDAVQLVSVLVLQQLQ